MTEIGARRRDFELGRVISRTFGVLGARGPHLILLAVLLFGLPQAAMAVVQYYVFGSGMGIDTSGLFAEGGVDFMTYVWFGLGSTGVAIVTQILMQAATIHVAVEDLKGRSAGAGAGLAVAIRNFFPLLALGILQTLGLMLGFILLIVPGVILSLIWAVCVPALVIEKSGVVGAFGRSADLTRNHRGGIFVLAILFIIASLLAAGLINGVGAALVRTIVEPSQVLLWTSLVVDPVSALVSNIVGAVGVAALYFELRWVKSAPEEHQELAAIFD